MPDCDYCGESFDGEGAYLDHLEAQHAGDLGAIDRRRLEARDSGEADRDLTRPALVLLGALVIGGVYLVFVSGVFSGNAGAGEGIESEPLPDSGDAALLEAVETSEPSSREHVPEGTDIDYETMPPAGGPHYGSTVDPGFYESEQTLGALVHNLEHGHVVVYYDPDAIDAEARESLEAFVAAHSEPWAAVVVVPTPVENPDSAYVLTAWGAKLAIEDYDAAVVRAFLAEYLGRGPERPVR